MMRQKGTLLMAAALSLATIVAGCGGSSTSTQSSAHQTGAARVARTPDTPTTPAQKARFVGRAGSAVGIFHHYVYEPFKTGSLKDRVALKKAAAAVDLAARDVARAKDAAVVSTSLRKLYAPLAGLQLTLSTLSTNLGRGHADRADIKLANAGMATLKQIGSATGVKIEERVPVRAPSGLR